MPESVMARKLKVMTVFGTRPEAIKMAPVVLALQQQPEVFESVVCVTAQHREMLDQVLSLFEITPTVDLDIMKPNQDLFDVTTNVLLGIRDVLDTHQPDVVLVHGDTTTTMATSLACFYRKIPVGHVEAGLRTFNKYYPFPEEVNRLVTDSVATLYFAPTERSAGHLRDTPGIDKAAIFVTGNTVVDALLHTLNDSKPLQGEILAETQAKYVEGSRRQILLTTHRRENFGEPLRAICAAVLRIVASYPDVDVVVPVHPNPNVKEVLDDLLGNHPQIRLIPPQEYAPFCRLMAESTLILTDSGGIQEEAPSLGKPVLVLRDETERPEAVSMGTVKLVGPHEEALVTEVSRLLDDSALYQAMAQKANPYGDGCASTRILEALISFGRTHVNGFTPETSPLCAPFAVS